MSHFPLILNVSWITNMDHINRSQTISLEKKEINHGAILNEEIIQMWYKWLDFRVSRRLKSAKCHPIKSCNFQGHGDLFLFATWILQRTHALHMHTVGNNKPKWFYQTRVQQQWRLIKRSGSCWTRQPTPSGQAVWCQRSATGPSARKIQDSSHSCPLTQQIDECGENLSCKMCC